VPGGDVLSLILWSEEVNLTTTRVCGLFLRRIFMQELLLLLFGLVIVLWIWFANRTHKTLFNTVTLLLRGVKTKGYVKGLSPTKDSDDATLYYVEVAFKDAQGEAVTFTNPNATNFYKPEIGTEVNVLYIPQNPTKAILHQFHNYIAVLLHVCLLLFAFTICLYQLMVLLLN
jgi:hypothetical protein